MWVVLSCFAISSYLYFLQLKHLVLGGVLPCTGDVAIKIASYALQGACVCMFIHVCVCTYVCLCIWIAYVFSVNNMEYCITYCVYVTSLQLMIGIDSALIFS